MRFLRYHIVNLDLPPGTMVSANELSEVLGVSRTPIREAIHELNNSGLMKIFPQFGSQVSLIDYQKVHESRFIRLTLEKAVIEIACESMNEADLSQLEETLKIQEHYLTSENWSKLYDYDNQFHRQICVFTNKTMTCQVIETMQDHFDRVRLLSINGAVCARNVQEHQALFKSIRKGNKTSALRIITTHLSRYIEDEAFIRAQYKEYFVS